MGSLPAGHMPGVNELFRRHVPRLLLPETRAEAAPLSSHPLQLVPTNFYFTRRKRGRGSSPYDIVYQPTISYINLRYRISTYDIVYHDL